MFLKHDKPARLAIWDEVRISILTNQTLFTTTTPKDYVTSVLLW